MRNAVRRSFRTLAVAIMIRSRLRTLDGNDRIIWNDGKGTAYLLGRLELSVLQQDPETR